MFNTEIEFITNNSVSSSTNVATGDFWFLCIATLTILTSITLSVVFFIKKTQKILNIQSNDSLNSIKPNNFIQKWNIIKSSRIKITIISAIIIFCLGVLISIFYFANNNIQAYASNNDAQNVQVPGKIYAKLDTNQKLNIDKLEIINNNDYRIAFKSFKLSQSNGTTDTSTWTIKYNGYNLFHNSPGSSSEVTESLAIEAHQNAVLEISNDMNYETARTMNGACFKLEYSLIKAPTQIAIEPTISKSLVYNGQEQIGLQGNDTIDLSGTISATNAGNYVAQATPKEGFEWEDKTRVAKTYNWSITQAQSKAKIENGQYFIDVDIDNDKSISIIYEGDGEAILNIEDENIVTADYNNNTLSLIGKSAGFTKGILSFKETNNCKATSFEFSVCVTKNYTGRSYFPLFNEDSLLPIPDPDAQMSGLEFSWNPYKFFNNDNKTYNKEFAKFFAAINGDILDATRIELDNVEPWDFDNCTKLYEELKMQDIKKIYLDPDNFEYDKHDVATFVVCHLNVKINNLEKELIIVTVAGTAASGKDELGSDLDIGTDKSPEYYPLGEHPEWKNYLNHKGFEVAYRRVSKEVSNYIQKFVSASSDKTILFSGHSRGAAICNLLGAEYENNNNYKCFDYCFATPGVTQDTQTNCSTIFNIKNINDLVPSVPLEKWGFKTLGTDIKADISSDIMQKEWKKSILKHPYVKFDTEAIINLLLDASKSREELYLVNKKLEPAYSAEFDNFEEAQDALNEKQSILDDIGLSHTVKSVGPEKTGEKYKVEILYTPSFFIQIVTNTINIITDGKHGVLDILSYLSEILNLDINIPTKFQKIIQHVIDNIDTIVPGFICNHSLFTYYILPAILPE